MVQEFQTWPNDQMAEKIVLGTMLTSPAAASAAMSLLVGADFYLNHHGTIFETVVALHENREPTEIGAVHARMLANGTLGTVGGPAFLVGLVEIAATPSQVAYYASLVAEHAHRRELIKAGTELVQRAFEANGLSSDELNDWAASRIAAAALGSGEAITDDGLSEEDLLACPPDYDWLIPGLLERGDRLMITGAEGSGKSTLTRQIAVQAAAGIHPFTARRSAGVRVLVVDCENGERLSKRRYNPLLRAARDAGAPIGSRLRVHLEPGGLDLTARGGAGWLLRRVERFNPDLLVIGPLYRLHFGDPNDERDARKVAAALDRVREVADCGLILEAHSPHQATTMRSRVLRPVGSSLWMRWPEFGYGIAREDTDAGRMFRVSDLRAWRGPRDERAWPRKLRTGSPWPWVDDDNDQPAWPQ